MTTTLVIIITTLSFLHTGKASLLRGNKNRNNAIIIDDRLPSLSSMHLRGFEGSSGRRMKKKKPPKTTETTSTTITSSTTTQCGKKYV